MNVETWACLFEKEVQTLQSKRLEYRRNPYDSSGKGFSSMILVDALLHDVPDKAVSLQGVFVKW